MPWNIPWGLCWQWPYPYREPQLTPDSPGDPPRPGPGSYRVTVLSLVLVHVKPCVCSPGVESLFPSVLWNSCTQALLAFKTKCSEDISTWCQTHRLDSLTWGSELSLLWENLFTIIIFQFEGCLPGGYGIWLYCEIAPPTILLWLFFFFLVVVVVVVAISWLFLYLWM